MAALYGLSNYIVRDAASIASPALIYYKDIILSNTAKAIKLAGGSADRLWPHVKSHKAPALIKMQADFGIRRFKCATIAEAEMTASALCDFSSGKDASNPFHILLAYPLVGPNIERFLNLKAAFPDITFYAIGDDADALKKLSDESEKRYGKDGEKTYFLIDVDTGQHRTGVSFDKIKPLALAARAFSGIVLRGLHCYDGHIHDSSRAERDKKTAEIDRAVLSVKDGLSRDGFDMSVIIMGGTPTFPCRTELSSKEGLFLSPGTCFISDHGYSSNYADMDFPPGAAVLARVISCPSPRTFTLDLGYKAIASDPPAEARGVIAGMEGAKPLFQNEEHWVWETTAEKNPKTGDVFYVIPTHICPTSALYSEITAVSNGEIDGIWKVAARDRKLNY